MEDRAVARTALLVLVGLFCCADGARADSFLLVIKSARIAKTKKDGRAWDAGIGKVSYPDPYVKVQVYDADGGLADGGETAFIKDTFTPVWNQEVATVQAGWKVKFEVWDKDLKFDDEIGKHELKI